MPKRRTQQRSIWPLVMVVLGLVLIFGAVGFLINASQTPEPVSNQAANPAIPYPDIQRVSLADARAAWEAGTAVFVDVRGTQYYETEHIQGALDIPEDGMPANLTQLDPQSWIITYCT